MGFFSPFVPKSFRCLRVAAPCRRASTLGLAALAPATWTNAFRLLAGQRWSCVSYVVMLVRLRVASIPIKARRLPSPTRRSRSGGVSSPPPSRGAEARVLIGRGPPIAGGGAYQFPGQVTFRAYVSRRCSPTVPPPPSEWLRRAGCAANQLRVLPPGLSST